MRLLWLWLLLLMLLMLVMPLMFLLALEIVGFQMSDVCMFGEGGGASGPHCFSCLPRLPCIPLCSGCL